MRPAGQLEHGEAHDLVLDPLQRPGEQARIVVGQQISIDMRDMIIITAMGRVELADHLRASGQ